MNSVALIIPAAGSGERLNHSIPKPFIEIAGKSILEHTLSRFTPVKGLRQVVIATSAEYLERARSICRAALPPDMDFGCLVGGEQRQDSIFNALQQVKEADLVAVHDAVRPFVETVVIDQCIEVAEDVGGAVVGVPAKDTIKKVDDDQVITDTPERKYLWQTQTPQIFKKEILNEAYAKAEQEHFQGTDDSSLVERLGYTVKMVKGNHSNFKITYPVDLKLAKLLLGESG
ncbi:2-C-methyl-D-erythritol 4-phosphate cytidylyltransferase [Aliifodinibius sp. S!AR15-10]|uniref:2-C-methyl-D-erythritol 4-phosphate cytidylyltransferase n=1 Tax=Aliifodinibius sp. S!AR15-10 TaxID=2950437 RepID=UPI00285A7A57|nr:2-C-methyl-D-erythritol 4-phosphate cytidylyltransferase [Aliifodinibius sp. S!AR15-10]MDR8394100.1 2-C-methyl-D-erythritol 4-phosphate cytidylyltransferase [Aliifodinibius sp. S!AR15-10]